MILELIHSMVRIRSDMEAYFLPFLPRNVKRVDPIAGIEYRCAMKSYNRWRRIRVNFDDEYGTIIISLYEQNRITLYIKHKISDPNFEPKKLPKLIDQWLHWKVKYQEFENT